MNDKKNILFVMDGMKIGGVENALISVLNRFDYEHFDVDLLLLHEHMDLLDEVNPSVGIYHYEQKRKVPHTARFLFWYLLFMIARILHFDKLKNYLSLQMQHCAMRNQCEHILPKKYECAIAYKQGEAENCVAYCIPARRKIAFYHHGSIIDDDLHQKTYALYDKIVAVSSGVEAMLRKHYPQYAWKMTTIQNYADCDAIVHKAQEFVPDIGRDKKIICSVGRLCEEKRFDRAIEAASILKQRGLSFVWYIIGEGELRHSLEQKIEENGVQHCVILAGSMKNPLPYVKACDVYVQTSDAESYGLAIQEAMVLNRPVVSTRTIGGQYLVKYYGYGELVEKDAYDISSAILSSFEHQANVVGIGHTDEYDYDLDMKWKELLTE